MEVRQHIEQLDIAIIPAMKLDYYRDRRARYMKMLDPTPRQLPPKPPDYYIQAASPEAKDLMFSVFRSLKRSSGYGR